MPTIAELHHDGIVAAKTAAEESLKRWGGDRDACGFAWVVIYDVKLSSKDGKEFKALGFTKGYGKGAGIELWNPSGSNVQSVSIKEDGARAYAKVFEAAGYTAYSNSRLD